MARRLFPFLLALAVPLAAQVKVTHHPGRITVDIDGKPFTEFFVTNELNKPFLHPLRTASGKTITRFYPMEMREGEAHDHPHHRGLWFTHGDVNGLDFWANETRDPKKGRVVLRKIHDIQDGKKSGLIDATFEWVDQNSKPLLSEFRRMVFHSDPKLRIIDFDITLTAQDEAVKLGDTKEGTFALRLRSELEEAGKRDPQKFTGKMVNAEGLATEEQVWGKRSPWVDYCGTVEGEALGVAIFEHPISLRSPTYWHSRGYGLFAANPFGAHDFERNKEKDGSFNMAPHSSVQFRYRVVIHPGDTQAAGIKAMYERYAKGR